MKKFTRYIKHLLKNDTHLSSNIFMSLPKMTVIGQNHMYIENHHELVVFTDSTLKLKLHKGHVLIEGESFVLKTMLPREILLEGTITNVQFIE